MARSMRVAGMIAGMITGSVVLVGCRAMSPSADSRPMVLGGKASNIEIVGKISDEIFIDGFTECTGTLIAPNMVLTAAHCVMKPDCDDSACGYHTGHMSGQYFQTEGQSVPVKFGWSLSTGIGSGDIGLLLLSRDVKVDRFRMRYKVRLATELDPNGGNYVIGYGCTKTTKQPGESAQPSGETSGARRYASIDKGYYQACPGDSGGPLATITAPTEKSRRVSIFGVVSTWVATLSDAERADSPVRPLIGRVGDARTWIIERVKKWGSAWPAGGGLSEPVVAPPPSKPVPKPTPVVTSPSRRCVNYDEWISVIECRAGMSSLTPSQCAALIERRERYGRCP